MGSTSPGSPPLSANAVDVSLSPTLTLPFSAAPYRPSTIDEERDSLIENETEEGGGGIGEDAYPTRLSGAIPEEDGSDSGGENK